MAFDGGASVVAVAVRIISTIGAAQYVSSVRPPLRVRMSFRNCCMMFLVAIAEDTTRAGGVGFRLFIGREVASILVGL